MGKTVTAACICASGQADYWKPVQAGGLDCTDTDELGKLVEGIICHPESFRLTLPASPHKAAAHDGISLNVADFVAPKTEKHLVIEGAGGLLVPLNDRETMLDLAIHLDTEIILVIRNYLGSINHSLLTIETLWQRGVDMLGIVFCGHAEPSSEEYIIRYSGLKNIWKIPQAEEPTPLFINKNAQQFSKLWA